jgi:nucleoside-diphosphate-sugar epimerase
MKILVLGASGLLGSNILTNFKKKHEIVGPTRKRLDLSNSLSLTNIENDFDVLIYCAQYRPKSFGQTEDPSELENINGISINWLINYLPKLQKIIYMSTGGLYENSQELLSEISPIKKLGEMSPYFRSKIKTEELLLNSAKDIDVNILRIFTMYGKGAHSTSLMPRLNDKINKQESIHSSMHLGDRLRPVHVLDVVNAIEHLLSYKKSGIFNIGGPEVLYFQDIVHRIAELNKFKPKFAISNEKQITLAPDNKLLTSTLYLPKIYFSGHWDSNI